MSNAQDVWLTPNNRLPHWGALQNGYRALMVDLYLHDDDFDEGEQTPKVLYTCHGLCAFGKRSAAAEFNVTKTWLDRNPNEVVQFFFENPDSYRADVELKEELQVRRRGEGGGGRG
jgi:hypothetical protein